jgi:phosphoglycerate dehydrogenase-like enzyme
MNRVRSTTLLCAVLVALSAHSYAADSATKQSVSERYQLEEAALPVRERAGWKKAKRILLVGGSRDALAELQSVAPGVEIVRAGNELEAQSKAGNVDVVIGACTPGIFEAGKAIRWVQVFSAGVEGCVGIPAVKERGILVTNMQRIMGPVIAEHVTAMMLALTRGLDAYIPAQRERAWKRDAAAGRMAVVEGKTMLVVGLGGIGTEIAKRAHALGMRVIATRASGRTGPEFVSYVGLPEELHKLASEADVVVNATPLTPQTTNLFDAAFFSKMKPTAYFINIGRGKSVVTSALVDALSKGAIGGAGLDVTEPEPLPSDHPLWSLPNVVITPHVAANSDLGFAAQIEVVKENVRRYVAGERMLSVVDVSRGY